MELENKLKLFGFLNEEENKFKRSMKIFGFNIIIGILWLVLGSFMIFSKLDIELIIFVLSLIIIPLFILFIYLLVKKDYFGAGIHLLSFIIGTLIYIFAFLSVTAIYIMHFTF